MAGPRSSSIGLLTGFLCLASASRAQLTTGTLEGFAEYGPGQPAASIRLEIEGPLGRILPLAVDSQGRFSANLPYGVYTVRAPTLQATCRARIRPLATTRCALRTGENQIADVDALPPFTANNLAQLLLLEAPGAAVYPLDFASVGSTRLPLIAGQSAAEWSGTSFRLNGVDATDSYQPGLPVMLDDLAAVDSVAVHEAYAAGTVPLDAYDAGAFLRAAASDWHFGLSTQDTRADFAGDNLPPLADRGSVERPDEFLWFTRDSSEFDGVFGRWADVAATATGQWASQTAPERPDGTSIGSRMLFANVRGRGRLSTRDQIDALYSGSRVDLSSGGWPAGMEAFLASPLMPSFYGVSGFENLREVDHFDLVQTGWTHQFDGARVFEFRYGYSTAHLDTAPAGVTNGPATIDLLDPSPVDAPFSNFAIRTRHEFDAVYQAGRRLAVGADFEASQPRNRFQSPSSEDTITVAGQPAFLVRFNVPADTRVHVDGITPNVRDVIQLPYGVTLDFAFVLDVARGAVAGQPAAISWTSPSPRAGFAVPFPRFSRLVLRGDYAAPIPAWVAASWISRIHRL